MTSTAEVHGIAGGFRSMFHLMVGLEPEFLLAHTNLDSSVGFCLFCATNARDCNIAF